MKGRKGDKSNIHCYFSLLGRPRARKVDSSLRRLTSHICQRALFKTWVSIIVMKAENRPNLVPRQHKRYIQRWLVEANAYIGQLEVGDLPVDLQGNGVGFQQKGPPA